MNSNSIVALKWTQNCESIDPGVINQETGVFFLHRGLRLGSKEEHHGLQPATTATTTATAADAAATTTARSYYWRGRRRIWREWNGGRGRRERERPRGLASDASSRPSVDLGSGGRRRRRDQPRRRGHPGHHVRSAKRCQPKQPRPGGPLRVPRLLRLRPTSHPSSKIQFKLLSRLEILTFVFFQCHAGHLVCSSCRPKLTCCPTCRGQLGGNIRNLAMEKVASTVMFPCRYQSSGCALSLLHTEKTDHEEACEYRPYSCPCPGASCKWQGSLEQVMSHLMQVHKSITTLQGEDIVFLATDINLPGAVDWVMMQSCFNHHFM